MTTPVTIVPVRQRRVVVTTAATVLFDGMALSYPATVTAVPAGGGSIRIEYSTTPSASDSTVAATASWTDWPVGTTSVRASATLVSPITAMRFTATVADGAVEVCA